jgi:hypothetical protein
MPSAQQGDPTTLPARPRDRMHLAAHNYLAADRDLAAI